METTVIDKGMRVVRRVIPRALRAHPFVMLLTVGVLFGGGLRFVSTSAAAGTAGPGSTACAAK
jgi:hypothetical protein